jgi:hypothetical protein
MALTMLQCYGDASLPQQLSILRAVDPLDTKGEHIRLFGGRSLLTGHVDALDWASCGALGGHFRRRRPCLCIAVFVVVYRSAR